MSPVRRRWKIKPFSRIRESEKVYRRASERETVRRSERESEGRVLALDVGLKRIGVAISDPLKLTARGLATLSGETVSEMLSLVEDIIKERDVVEIVVGHPLLMSGGEGEMAEMVREFARGTRKEGIHPDNLMG